jgi:outer membrane protein OmpA-like peptidoglycan-associated protein
MYKNAFTTVAFAILFCTNLYSQESRLYENLAPEHREMDWEQISLDVLVKEIESEAEELGLEQFKVQVKGRSISIIYRDILFPPDSPEVTDETREKINKMARVIDRFTDKILLIEGHSAKIPNQTNDGTILSNNRAAAVAGVLSETGIFSLQNIETNGYGDSVPIAENDTQEGRSLNRRVELSIIDELDRNENNKPSNALWWRTLSDLENPGYSVFMFDTNEITASDIEGILASEGYKDLSVYNTLEGIAVIYPGAEYQFNTAIPKDSTLEDVSHLTQILPVDNRTQVRIGGRNGETQSIDAMAYQYSLGHFIALSTGILPENTLINDEPLSFVFNENLEYGDFSFNRLIDSLDLAVIETNPIARYREFSYAGIGLAMAVNFKIPAFDNNPHLAPFRFSMGLNGLYHFPETTSSVESMWEGEWDLSLGYRLSITPALTFTPMLAYGGTVHILTATLEGSGEVNGEPYYSQTAAFKTDFELSPEKWIIGERTKVAIFMQIGYRVFFDSEYLGHSILIKPGIRFDF